MPDSEAAAGLAIVEVPVRLHAIPLLGEVADRLELASAPRRRAARTAGGDIVLLTTAAHHRAWARTRRRGNSPAFLGTQRAPAEEHQNG